MTYYDSLRAALSGPFAPLTHYQQFMLWRLEPDASGGKPRKIPYRIDGQHGSSTDPTAWVDAQTALQAAENTGMYVAFVLTDNDPFVFIDVDNCVVNAQWNADALQTFAQFPGAAFEMSQSGAGFHLFMQGQTPSGFTGRKRAAFECYRTGRYVALTGYGAQGSPLVDFGVGLSGWIADKFPLTVTDDKVGELKWNVGPIAEWNGPTDDETLLQQFLSAPLSRSVSDAFRNITSDAVADTRVTNAQLFNADVAALAAAFPSDKGDAFDRSNAAFSLACRLAYWTGKDCPRIERLMNRAAFRRTKADLYHGNGVTYMHWDVMRACAMTVNVRYERAAITNAAVVADANTAYVEYETRISAAGNAVTLRAVCEEIANDLRIDRAFRALLVAAAHTQFGVLSLKIAKSDVERLMQLRSAHPAPDRQMVQRQANVALNLPEETVLLAPVMTTAEMLDEFVLIVDGSNVASIGDRNQCFSVSDWRNMMAASRTVLDAKTVIHSEEWMNHPARKMVLTRTFRAGAPVITADPGGRSALNLWRPTARPEYITIDVGAFIEHVNYLFGADADNFLDWLAHIEQYPGVLPHHGWLHIADNFGTGRNWLESVIARLWRGYVAPSVDMDALINGGFNGALAGRVIAIVDEIRAGAAENAYMMEGKIRNMLTEETRYIKPKYGKEYIEHNSCRWLLFSNHKNAIPMSDADRRWYVVHLGLAPRPEYVYTHLYALLDTPGFVDSIGVWLRQRDINRFNPGARPPINDAKRKAIAASKSDFQRIAGQIAKYWPSDLITNADLLSCMTEGEAVMGKGRLTAAMSHALEDVGMHRLEQGIYDDSGNRPRAWIVRNVDAWLQTSVGDGFRQATIAEFTRVRPLIKGSGFQTLTAAM